MGQALSSRMRELVVGFDRVSSEMSVIEFCHANSISTSTFYRLRERAGTEGTAAVLKPRSRAPRQPARRYHQDTDALISALRAQLETEGLEAGPWSIWWRMLQNGLAPVPSRATIARRLRAMGLAGPAPRKRPRSSWRRFARSLANELWQLDGMDYFLPDDDRLITVYQIVDDCTRFMIGLRARPGGESIAGTQQVLQAGFDQSGMPAALLTDNGSAFNTHRRGTVGETEIWLAGKGIRPISGSIRHPQTQGKVERAHQPVQAWLAAREIASLDQLNQSLDEFRKYYNHERQHQGLGLRITPAMAWESVGKAYPGDHPIPLDELYGQPIRLPQPSEPVLHHRTVRADTRLTWSGRVFRFGDDMANQPITLIASPDLVTIYDIHGALHATVPWPAPRPTKQTSINLRIPPHRIAPLSPKP